MPTKLAILSLLLLTACDPGGYYADYTCTARDNPTGQCTAATYSCDTANRSFPPQPRMLTYHRYDAPRCM